MGELYDKAMYTGIGSPVLSSRSESVTGSGSELAYELDAAAIMRTSRSARSMSDEDSPESSASPRLRHASGRKLTILGDFKEFVYQMLQVQGLIQVIEYILTVVA
jgi:hypothetical protein